MTKHPLSSKERRGLAAVAAAALLCILIPFILRSCSPYYPIPHSSADSATLSSDISDCSDKSNMTNKSNKTHKSDKSDKSNKKSKSSAKKKATKVYPTRQPLDEEI